MTAFVACLALCLGARDAIPLGDFDGKSFAPWTVTGDAFEAPYRPSANPRYVGYLGPGLAWSGRAGEDRTGTLVSPEFEIQRRFINFLVAGHRDLPASVGVELLVEGRVVRAASATLHTDPGRRLYARTWDVADLAGRKARVRINDNSPCAAIAVDHFVQADSRASAPIDASVLGRETYRPRFHFTAQRGWMNDPNGLVYYRGRWHLFHQHRWPGSGATAWGHAVSEDLVRWRLQPTAIAAEGRDAIFSGSGLVDHENASGLKQGPHDPILLFYTLMPAGPERGSSDAPRRATQCMAYSTDGGQTFHKYAGNPLLATPDFRDRDPKVFFDRPTRTWWMLLSLSKNNLHRDQGEYGLFHSPDLKSWQLQQRLGPGLFYWECPDMFELAVEGVPGRKKWLLLRASGEYIVGTFDRQGFHPETGPIRNRWGVSYYATQTFNDAPAGRRVQLGWMNTGKPQAVNAYPGMPFNQQMSFPRELSLRATPDGLRLFRWPIAEIEKLHGKTHRWSERTLRPGENLLSGVDHDLLDIELDVELGAATQVRLVLRGEELAYDRAERKLKAFGTTAPLAPVDGRVHLRVLLDLTSIELFGNRGEADISGVFFPALGQEDIALMVDGGPARIVDLRVREL